MRGKPALQGRARYEERHGVTALAFTMSACVHVGCIWTETDSGPWSLAQEALLEKGEREGGRGKKAQYVPVLS